MSYFLRLLTNIEKASVLAKVCESVRNGEENAKIIVLDPKVFRAFPTTSFAYWTSEEIRMLFRTLQSFQEHGYDAVNGLTTGDDFRFVRAHWEVNHTLKLSDADSLSNGIWRWVTYAKGGEDSPFYCRFPLVLNWHNYGREMKAFPGTIIRSEQYYLQEGLTWPLRARRFGPQCRPLLSVFSVRGYSAIIGRKDILPILSLCNSSAFDYLYKVSLGRHGFPEFVVGILKQLPLPDTSAISNQLEQLARRAWWLRRTIDSVEETSHAFMLPGALRSRENDYDPPAIEVELDRIKAELDDLAFSLYGFCMSDRAAAQMEEAYDDSEADDGVIDDDGDGEDNEQPVDLATGLLSWAVGVAFGRFDWRLATGERAAPPQPEPFDPLSAKSPGMLPDGAQPFHVHGGILVDDPGHSHDLTRLVEEVLVRVDAPVPPDVRRWLQRDFFPFHLQRYSKSRRKAPIYWPLSTASGSYTLWVYYPNLTTQTLYTAVNDFIEPKLKQVGQEASALRTKGSARSREEDRALEALQALEQELMGLRETLLQIAPTYRPNQDDGVQITAAPLWPLFRHKPWQKLLKETWAKLEKGDYDWAHLAMAYWPDRIREKCKTDKSLSIAHDLEHLYVEPEPAPAKARGRKKGS